MNAPLGEDIIEQKSYCIHLAGTLLTLTSSSDTS